MTHRQVTATITERTASKRSPKQLQSPACMWKCKPGVSQTLNLEDCVVAPQTVAVKYGIIFRRKLDDLEQIEHFIHELIRHKH